MVEIYDYQSLESQDIGIASNVFIDSDVETIEIVKNKKENISSLSQDEFDRKDFRLIIRNDGSTYYVDNSTYGKKNTNKDISKESDSNMKKFFHWFYSLFNS